MPNKQQRKQRRRQIMSKIGGAASNLGRKAMSSIGSLVKQKAKEYVNQVITQGSSAIMSGGIPFPTSGMLASASPSGGLSGGIQVSAPAANGRVQRSSEPRIRSRANGNTSVSHREYVADINVEEVGFDLQFQYGINPGNGALFPWLSQVASRYETYSFQSLKIIYEPQCGTASTGTLMLAIDYDSSDAPPTSKSQMMSYKNAVRAPLWFAAVHQSSPPDLHRLKTNYILSGAAPPNTDIKTYDIGNLFVAIQSAGSSQTAGELYVEYVVDLMTPQIENDPLSLSLYTPFTPVALNVVNPFFNGDGSPIYTVAGPLPVLVQQQPGTPNVTEFYIGNAGYYLISLSYTQENPVDAPLQGLGFVSSNSPQLFASLTEQLSEGTPSNLQQAIISYVQIVNPEVLGFYFVNESMPANTTGAIWITITQISELAVLDSTGLPVSKLANPRARLGRIRPAPPLPSPLSRVLRKASDKVPHSPKAFKQPTRFGVRRKENAVQEVLNLPESGASPASHHDFTHDDGN